MEECLEKSSETSKKEEMIGLYDNDQKDARKESRT